MTTEEDIIFRLYCFFGMPEETDGMLFMNTRDIQALEVAAQYLKRHGFIKQNGMPKNRRVHG